MTGNSVTEIQGGIVRQIPASARNSISASVARKVEMAVTISARMRSVRMAPSIPGKSATMENSAPLTALFSVRPMQSVPPLRDASSNPPVRRNALTEVRASFIVIAQIPAKRSTEMDAATNALSKQQPDAAMAS